MSRIPVIPTRDLGLFPDTITNIFVGRKESLASLDYAMKNKKEIILVAQKDIDIENPNIHQDLYFIGVKAKVIQTANLPNKNVKALIDIKDKIKIDNFILENNIIFANSEEVKEIDIEKKEIKSAMLRKVTKLFEEYIFNLNKISPDIIFDLKKVRKTSKKLYLISHNLMITSKEKQEILEIDNLENKALKIIEIILRENELIKLEKKIETEVKEKIAKTQKDYYIKEKINLMKEELSDVNDENEEILELKNKMNDLNLSFEVTAVLKKEIKKLAKMPSFSAEATVTRSYIEILLELPWDSSTNDNLKLKNVKEKLNSDHYGLDKVKDRILEYLAVKKMNPENKGNIICLLGPPGVGKTSLAKSVADAIGRKFARVSLGGVRDESEIRGHRKTYVGSMPGRIIKAVKKSNVNNPLILLDELDKMSSDFKGDPAAAMLEVLDPAQNKYFHDHYLDIPFDLSDIFFIATANDLSNIPTPLRDRMELISLSSYTEYEKINIAKQYLIKNSKMESGLGSIKIDFSDRILLKIINEYTRESGVRTLKRTIDTIHRKIAKMVLEEDIKKVKLTLKNLESFLGKPKYREANAKKNIYKVGVVNGMAWTSIGGTTLEVQGVLIPENGKMELTGTLGKVMQESAAVALTYVKANMKTLKIKDINIFENNKIHLHFPEGATPKDGPSAGITITSSIVSLLSNKKIRQDIAMTGEITITGEVLAVGGIKEKVLGAHRVGIREVILPFENKSDISDIPEEILSDMKFHFAKTYQDVAKIIFIK